MRNTNLSLVVECFEIGIPIIHNNTMYKMDDDYNIQQAIVRTMNNEIETGYMYNIPMDICKTIAKNLTDGDRLNLVHLLVQVKTKLEKGHERDNITYNHERDFFNKLEESIKELNF